jgi:hypothetical protein
MSETKTLDPHIRFPQGSGQGLRQLPRRPGREAKRLNLILLPLVLVGASHAGSEKDGQKGAFFIVELVGDKCSQLLDQADGRILGHSPPRGCQGVGMVTDLFRQSSKK